MAEALLLLAIQRNDLDCATQLIREEGGVSSVRKSLSFCGSSAFPATDKGLQALAETLKVNVSVESLILYTTASSTATHEGFIALLSALKASRCLVSLTLGKDSREDLKKHEGGWLTAKSSFLLGEIIAGGGGGGAGDLSPLQFLDLSRNIKLGGPGLTAIAKGITATFLSTSFSSSSVSRGLPPEGPSPHQHSHTHYNPPHTNTTSQLTTQLRELLLVDVAADGKVRRIIHHAKPSIPLSLSLSPSLSLYTPLTQSIFLSFRALPLCVNR